MKNILKLTLLPLLLVACQQDSIETVKKSKIKDSDLTWGQAAERFSYCKDGTKQWLIVEQREDGKQLNFTCSLDSKSIAELSKKIPNIESAEYTMELWHWKDPRRIAAQGEFSGGENIRVTLKDGMHERYRNPIRTDYFIENRNPIDMRE